MREVGGDTGNYRGKNLMSALNKVLEAVVILSFPKLFIVHSPSGLVVLKCKSDHIKNQIILT